MRSGLHREAVSTRAQRGCAISAQQRESHHTTRSPYLYGQPPGGPLDINHADELRPYEKTRLECRAFVEQLALRWPKPA